MTKRQDVNGFTGKGFILQAIALALHCKHPQQLKKIGDRVGRERIQVVHGGEDRLITITHGEVLAQGLGVHKVVVEERGHVLAVEERAGLRRLVTNLVEKTSAM